MTTGISIRPGMTNAIIANPIKDRGYYRSGVWIGF